MSSAAPRPFSRIAAPVATALAAAGVLLALVAFLALDWFRPGPGPLAAIGGGHSSFADVRDFLTLTRDQVQRQGLDGYVSFGSSYEYFHWVAWVLLAAAAVATAVAVSAVGARHWSVKWLAAVVDLLGAALTVVSLSLFSFAGNPPPGAGATPSFGQYVSHGSWGAWFAVAGFALLSVAALLPRRR